MSHSEPPTTNEAAWIRGLAHVTTFVCAVLLLVMTAIISWQIFGRYILNDTPKWSEQLAGVLMVYLTMLGGALGVRDNVHIALTFFHDRFSKAWRHRSWYIIHTLLAVFGLGMMFYGVRMAQLVHEWTIPTLGISQGANYWSFPVSGFLILVFTIQRIKGGPERDESMSNPVPGASGQPGAQR